MGLFVVVGWWRGFDGGGGGGDVVERDVAVAVAHVGVRAGGLRVMVYRLCWEG